MLVVVLVVVLTGGERQYAYRLLFQNASQVVEGGTVRIGGTQVGTVTSIDLDDRDRAEVWITVAGDFAPLRGLLERPRDVLQLLDARRLRVGH